MLYFACLLVGSLKNTSKAPATAAPKVTMAAFCPGPGMRRKELCNIKKSHIEKDSILIGKVSYE